MSITVIAKDISQIGETDTALAITFAVKDNDETVPAKFIQTQDLTTACVGITDYGTLFANTVNTQLSTHINVTAETETGETVVGTATMLQLCTATLGTELTDV